MRILPWLRGYARSLAALALTAFVLQMVGGFGHTHLSHGIATAAATSATQLGKAALATSSDEALAHKAKLPIGTDSDTACAICLAGALVASAVTAAAPVLVLPIAYLLLGPPPTVAIPSFTREPAGFWSRGPPLI